MGFLLDFKYALRRLAKSPKFTVLTCFILMGGLTVSLLAFNFVYTMALKPLATPQGDSIYAPYISGDYPKHYFLAQDIQAIGQQQLADIYQQHSLSYAKNQRLSLGNIGRNAKVEFISGEFFALTRFKPLLGRGFSREDEAGEGAKVAVIGYRLWQMLFGGEPSVLGASIKLDDQHYEIVGVMPKDYRFPINSEVWVPLGQAFWHSPQAKAQNVDLLTRLKPEVAIEQADKLLTNALSLAVNSRLSSSEKADYAGAQVEHLTIPQRHLAADALLMFLGFQGIALGILLMACINTGNLLFARSIERQKESAIRAALGATNKRLIAQLVFEGGLLTLLGGTLAILLSGWLIDVIDQAMHQNVRGGMPFWFHWQLDWQTLFVACASMALTFVFACLIPAMRATKMDINAVLRDGTRGALGKKAGKVSRVLVTVQVALIACLMLSGSLGVVLITNMVNLIEQKPLAHRYQAHFDLSPVNAQTFTKDLLVKLDSIEQIEQSGLLLHRGPSPVRVDGKNIENGVDILLSSGNLAIYYAELLAGRPFDSGDNADNERVAMVSESFVNRYWQGGEAVGRRIDVDIDGQFISHRIIAVVSDQIANTQGVFAPKARYDEVYLSFYQRPVKEVELTFITNDDFEAGVEAFYGALFALDAKSMLKDFEDNLGMGNSVLGMFRLVIDIIWYCGLFALFLALMGVFGVAASAVALRRQEIGVRRALGAKDTNIILLFLKRNMKPLAIGLGFGLGVYSLVCVVFSTLVGDRIELGTYVSIAALTTVTLSVILCLAAYFPTRAAIVQEPFETLRAD